MERNWGPVQVHDGTNLPEVVTGRVRFSFNDENGHEFESLHPDMWEGVMAYQVELPPDSLDLAAADMILALAARVAELEDRLNEALNQLDGERFTSETLLKRCDHFNKKAEAAEAEVARLREAIQEKGGTEHSPTQWAYDQACVAIEKHRSHAARLREVLAGLLAPRWVPMTSTELAYVLDCARAALQEEPK